MSTIDIRDTGQAKVTRIIFRDEHPTQCPAVELTKYSDEMIQLVDEDGDGDDRICFEDIDNVIKALQKAKELWA